ncbi:alpha/beta hydrolase, partial [Corynebacterium stationis]
MSYSVSGNPVRGIVIATHGVGDSAASLSDIATHFGSSFQVYLVDLLGHGHAPRLSDEQLQDPFAAVAEHFEGDLAQIINAAPGGLPVIVLGHSFGGAVAAHVARRNPQL